MSPLPFKLKHCSGAGLAAQVAANLRGAIRSGHYPPGARLPSIVDMAVQLGVSDRIVRRAVQALAEAGEVTARRRRGIQVVGDGEKAWRKHVLFIQFGESVGYYRRHHRVEDILTAANIRVTPVRFGTGRYDLLLQRVQTVLDTQPVDLTVIAGGGDAVVHEVEQRHVPFVTVENADRSPQALAHVDIDLHDADLLARHCRTCGVRNAAIMVYSLSEPERFQAAFARLHMGCEIVRATAAVDTSEAVEHAGLAAMRTVLARRERPDFVYFTDDFLARGAIVAMLEAGARVPEDLQFALLATRGSLPAFRCALTRFELDPVAEAEAIGAVILSVLRSGRPRKRPLRLAPCLVTGETTRPRRATGGGACPATE